MLSFATILFWSYSVLERIFMVAISRRCVLSLFCCMWCSQAPAQSSPSAISQSSDSQTSNDSSPAQDQSLADIARNLRAKKPVQVEMTAEDTKQLFRSVDSILTFASEDTGFARRTPVNRRMIAQSDVEKFSRERLSKLQLTPGFVRAEMTMKKLGLLPREFNLSEFLVKSNTQEIAAYYDYQTKTISMLNWISLENQRPILAHELTHALQDQNYDLSTWLKAGERKNLSDKKEPGDQAADESALARRAVVEGQAMVVYVDFLLSRFGRSLQSTPGILAQMEEPAVSAAVDTALLHDAPYVLREMGTFPYREGLIFEGELLEKAGKRAAFAGPFMRPPRNTHEVLQPRAYLEAEKMQPIRIPDMRQLLADRYELYDSGNVGELDVRALLKQYDQRKIAAEIAAAWQGGVYAAFRRSGGDPVATPKTADLALVFVSKWKSPQVARQFARIYANTVALRYQTAAPESSDGCSADPCPYSRAEISTEEGPVIVEQWPDNTVIVSESFDARTAAKLVDAIRNQSAEVHAETIPQKELGQRLYDLPAFQQFQVKFEASVISELLKRANKLRTQLSESLPH